MPPAMFFLTTGLFGALEGAVSFFGAGSDFSCLTGLVSAADFELVGSWLTLIVAVDLDAAGSCLTAGFDAAGAASWGRDFRSLRRT